MSAPIPEDLLELNDSTAQWDGSLMVRFAQTHGIPLPWELPPDVAVRRYLIERVTLLAEINTELVSTHNTHVILVARTEERIAALEAQVQTLRKALTGRLPIDELTEVVRAVLAATEEK